MKNAIVLLLLIFAVSCSKKSGNDATQIADLKAQINKITAGKNATVGVSVRNFGKPFDLNINGEKHLPTLSVYKFHIALALLKMVDDKELSLDQKIMVKKADLLEDTWSPMREKYPNGNIELPLSEIIKYTVAQSDNNGCDILLRLVGGPEKVQTFMNEHDVRDFQIVYNEADMTYENMSQNYSSTESIVKLLDSFYRNKIVAKNSTDFLMKVMTETSTGENKLKSGLPKDVSLAHKTGASGRNKEGLTIAENDMGIVTLPNGDHYAICVFINNSTETDDVNCKMIADISKVIFDHFNKQ